MTNGTRLNNSITIVFALILLVFGSFLLTSTLRSWGDKGKQVEGANTIQNDTVYNKNIYVLIYNPLFDNGKKLSEYMNWEDPDMLVSQYIDWLKTNTNNKINVVVGMRNEISDFPSFIDGSKYVQTTYLACWNSNKCLKDSTGKMMSMDYNLVLKSLGICEYFNSKAIDEVWVLGAPNMGLVKDAQTGIKSSSNTIQTIPSTSCNKPMNIMGFDYLKGITDNSQTQKAIETIDNYDNKNLFVIGQGTLAGLSLGLGVFLMIKFIKHFA
jgi:hypothetical protein